MDQSLSDEKREVGNTKFKAGKLKAAASYYGDAASCCPLKTRHIPLCNRALARLKLGTPELCVEDCDRALELCPGYHKALFRRALARQALGDLPAALFDLRSCLALPSDAPNGMAAKVQATIDEIGALIASCRPTVYVGGAGDVERRRGVVRALLSCQVQRARIAALAAGGAAGGGDLAVDAALRPLAEHGDGAFEVYILELRTRYYECAVEVWVELAELAASGGGTAAALPLPPRALDRLEGVVLVNDVAGVEGASAEFLARVGAFTAAFEAHATELQICVACGPDIASDDVKGVDASPPFERAAAEGEEPLPPDVLTQADRERTVEWCVESGFEFVEARLGTERAFVIADAEITSRDKSGVPRILEAMESTMWSTIVRRNPVLAAAAAAVANGGAAAVGAAGQGDTAAAAAEAEAEAAAAAEQRTAAAAEAATAAASEAADAEDAGFVPSADADLMDMIDMAREVRRKGQGMTDSERRELAADAAMKLASQLGAL